MWKIGKGWFEGEGIGRLDDGDGNGRDGVEMGNEMGMWLAMGGTGGEWWRKGVGGIIGSIVVCGWEVGRCWLVWCGCVGVGIVLAVSFSYLGCVVGMGLGLLCWVCVELVFSLVWYVEKCLFSCYYCGYVEKCLTLFLHLVWGRSDSNWLGRWCCCELCGCGSCCCGVCLYVGWFSWLSNPPTNKLLSSHNRYKL